MPRLATLKTPRTMGQFEQSRALGLRLVDFPSAGAYDLISGRHVQNQRFSRSPWAFACMDIRASELASLPWRLVDRAGKVVTGHAIEAMLRDFGPESTYYESMRGTEIDLLMSARAFWLRDADRLVRLSPGQIEVQRNRSGITGFRQEIDGKETNRFGRDEIVYFREFNPDNELDPGPAVMTIVEKAIALEYEAGLYAEAFFKNDATPAVLVSTDQAVQEPEMLRVRDWWNRAFGGSRNKHKAAFADRGMKAQILSTSLRDIALTEIRERAQNDICAGFRVPKILVGAMEEATYANASEARRFMLEDVTIPRAKQLADVINSDLIHKIDVTVSFEFCPDELPILQEGANEKWARLESALAAGTITQEWARAEMGWPEAAGPPLTDSPAPDAEQDELRAWKRKAAKSLKAGGPAAVPFECYQVSADRQAAIRAELPEAGLDDLNQIFGG